MLKCRKYNISYAQICKLGGKRSQSGHVCKTPKEKLIYLKIRKMILKKNESMYLLYSTLYMDVKRIKWKRTKKNEKEIAFLWRHNR